ncbi:MAG TPA: hypothetical protein VHY79_09405 [Rhizomicrobium sp.]|jgi:hypothetical protein|nr:hypothetical protein [Rhizomicrobium sp.]
MDTIGGLLAILYLVGLVIAGVAGASVWVPVIGAVAGVALYHMVAPHARKHEAELWHGGHFGGLAQMMIGFYVVNFLAAAALYGAGRGIGYLV